MSLRTRLLVAIGVIALSALVIADVATYSALQSFLYQRVDQQLDVFHQASEHQLNSGRPLFCGAGPFGPGGGGAVPPAPEEAGRPSNAFQFGAVEVRSAKGAVIHSQ